MRIEESQKRIEECIECLFYGLLSGSIPVFPRWVVAVSIAGKERFIISDTQGINLNHSSEIGSWG